MTVPGQQDDTVSIVKAVQDNADRLGLTWTMQLATVVAVDNPLTPSVVFDSDQTGTPALTVSMVGNPGLNARVYVMGVADPSTSGINYIVGFATPAGTRMWSDRQVLAQAQSSFVVAVPPGVSRLEIDWTLRDTTGGFDGQGLRMLINADATNNYAYRVMQASGVSGTAVGHSQVFGTTAYAQVGIYPSNGSAAGRFGNGWIRFPAWNQPHSGNLGFTFASNFENALSDGWLVEGGGFYGPVGPYTTVTLLPQAGSTWGAGSQVIATGLIL